MDNIKNKDGIKFAGSQNLITQENEFINKKFQIA